MELQKSPWISTIAPFWNLYPHSLIFTSTSSCFDLRTSHQWILVFIFCFFYRLHFHSQPALHKGDDRTPFYIVFRNLRFYVLICGLLPRLDSHQFRLRIFIWNCVLKTDFRFTLEWFVDAWLSFITWVFNSFPWICYVHSASNLISGRKGLRDQLVERPLSYSNHSGRIDPSRVVQVSWRPRSGTCRISHMIWNYHINFKAYWLT